MSQHLSGLHRDCLAMRELITLHHYALYFSVQENDGYCKKTSRMIERSLIERSNSLVCVSNLDHTTHHSVCMCCDNRYIQPNSFPRKLVDDILDRVLHTSKIYRQTRCLVSMLADIGHRRVLFTSFVAHKGLKKLTSGCRQIVSNWMEIRRNSSGLELVSNSPRLTGVRWWSVASRLRRWTWFGTSVFYSTS